MAAKIGLELRNQYVLGFVPKNVSRDGKYRRVQVKLWVTTDCRASGGDVPTRYYAPAQ